MVKKLEEFASSVTGKVWAQLSLMALPVIFAGLMWFVVSWANDSKQADHTQLTAISAINAQLSALVATLDGGLRTQAAVDAAQDFRVGALSLDVEDHEARLRFLEQWRVNVINRDDPPL